MQVIDEHLWAGDRVSAGLEQVELCEGCRLAGPGSGDHGRALRVQMKLRGEGRINHRDLCAGIEEEVVRAGVVDGYGHDYLVALDKPERYTGDVPRAMCFCRKR